MIREGVNWWLATSCGFLVGWVARSLLLAANNALKEKRRPPTTLHNFRGTASTSNWRVLP